MPRGREPEIEHLLRRAGFGATEQEVNAYAELGFFGAVDELLEFDKAVDDVDANILQPGYVNVTTRGQFSPATVINDARQRWIFRMVHTPRPLQEKMTLFWHNHFATAYSKIAGTLGGVDATRVMAAKPSEDPGKVKGQVELLREYALGNFRDLLVAVTKDVAMLVWLDGRTNVRNRPQENYARELMELFTMGVGFYTEPDVYAGARVFTGWNLSRVGPAGEASTYYQFQYNQNQHDTSAKEFSFAVYPDGRRTIPARSAADGMQDGVDLINAVARHPETGRRLARKLWNFFISENAPPDETFVSEIAAEYYRSGYEMKPVVRRVLQSRAFRDPANWYARYSWPAEFVARSIKEVGWRGFSVNDAITPMTNMGQQLFEPPDVNGWDLGRGWYSTGAMLSRMNFAATLATNQRFNLRDESRAFGRTPELLLTYLLDRLTPASFDRNAYQTLLDYIRAGGAWSGSDAQLLTKTPGLVHLIVGSGEYQLV
jgi:uncharacterized protein (DUF1800 family)